MKNLLLTTACLSAFILAGCASKPPGPHHDIVWCGLDYSKVKMIGKDDFRQPDRIFPAMLLEWNKMFMEEAFYYFRDMEKDVKSEAGAVEVNNAKATAAQIQREDFPDGVVQESHITDADIAELVKGYQLQAKDGVGLVFVMDRLVKKQDEICAYIVFFDIASRKVLHSERRCGGASKGSFRTHWFKPIKGFANGCSGIYRKLQVQGML